MSVVIDKGWKNEFGQLDPHPLMCQPLLVPFFLWIFAGTNINIKFVYLGFKCAVPQALNAPPSLLV